VCRINSGQHVTTLHHFAETRVEELGKIYGCTKKVMQTWFGTSFERVVAAQRNTSALYSTATNKKEKGKTDSRLLIRPGLAGGQRNLFFSGRNP